MHHSGKPAESFAVKFLTDLWEKPDLRNHRTCEGRYGVEGTGVATSQYVSQCRSRVWKRHTWYGLLTSVTIRLPFESA